MFDICKRAPVDDIRLDSVARRFINTRQATKIARTGALKITKPNNKEERILIMVSNDISKANASCWCNARFID